MISNKRYPKEYVKICIKSNTITSTNNTNNKYKYADPKLIADNHNEILELCINDQNDKLKELINNLTNGKPISKRIWAELSKQCIIVLIKYCIKNDNVELFTTNIHLFCQQYIGYVMRYICKHNNPIPFLNILIENNIKITPDFVWRAFTKNNTIFISYLISIGHYIAEDFNVHASRLKYQPKDEAILSVLMLKMLMDNNIYISSENLNNLIRAAIRNNNLEVIEFLVESFPDYNINRCLEYCCYERNHELLVYFLKRGANIHSMKIDPNCLSEISINIVKILIDHDYPIAKKILNYILTTYFKNDIHLENVKYLLANGAQIQYVFDIEERGKNRDAAMHTYDGDYIYSLLELIITKGEFIKIKFLAENYLNLLKPELNRLFVLACANGRNDIATYLYDLGAELNDKALICAFYFGHLETIIMLLKLGMVLNTHPVAIKDDLFVLAYVGYVYKSIYSKLYDGLIDSTPNNTPNKNTIFRNDIYNYGVSTHLDIIKLLISHNIPTTNVSLMITPYSAIYNDVSILEYFIRNGLNINKRWDDTRFNENRNLLEGVIISAKPDKMYLDVIEFLLENGADRHIINKEAIQVVNNPVYEPIKILLLKYGSQKVD